MACSLPRLRPDSIIARAQRPDPPIIGAGNGDFRYASGRPVHPRRRAELLAKQAARHRAWGAKESRSEPSLPKLPRLAPERCAGQLGRTFANGLDGPSLRRPVGKELKSQELERPVPSVRAPFEEDRAAWWPGYGEKHDSSSPATRMVMRHQQRHKFVAAMERAPTPPLLPQSTLLICSKVTTFRSPSVFQEFAREGKPYAGRHAPHAPSSLARSWQPDLPEEFPTNLGSATSGVLLRPAADNWARTSMAHHEWVKGLLDGAFEDRATNARIAPVLEPPAAANAVLDLLLQGKLPAEAAGGSASTVFTQLPGSDIRWVMPSVASAAGYALQSAATPHLRSEGVASHATKCSPAEAVACKLLLEELASSAVGDESDLQPEPTNVPRGDENKIVHSSQAFDYFAERNCTCEKRAMEVFSSLGTGEDIFCDRLESAVGLLGHVKPNSTWIKECVADVQKSSLQQFGFESTDDDNENKSSWESRSYLDLPEFLAFASMYERCHFGYLRKVFELMRPDTAGQVSLAMLPESLEELGMSPMPGALHEIACDAVSGSAAEVCSCGTEFAFDAVFCRVCNLRRKELLAEHMVEHHATCPESVEFSLFAQICDLCEQRVGLTHWGFETLRELFNRCSNNGRVDSDGVCSVLALDHSNCIPDVEADEALVETLAKDNRGYNFVEFLAAMRQHREQGLRHARAQFDELDTDHKGFVEVVKMPAYLESLRFLTASPEILQEISQASSIGGDGCMSFDDVWRLLQHFNKQCGLSSTDISFIRSIFNTYDADGSGGMDASELRYFMRRMGFPATHERLHEIQEEFDTDGSGELEFDELLRLVARYREKEVQAVRTAFNRVEGGTPRVPHTRKSKVLKTRGQRLRSDAWLFEVLVAKGGQTSEQSISVSEFRNILHSLGYMPSEEQEVALVMHLGEGVDELGLWEVMSLVEKFRTWARDEFQQNQGFTELQLQELHLKFQTYDCEQLGHIKHSQVAQFLEDLYPDAGHSQAARQKLEDLLKVGDVSAKGHLDFAGYIRIMRAFEDEQDLLLLQKESAAMEALKFSHNELTELRQVFNIFDTDASGGLTIEELVSMVSVIVPGVAGQRLRELKQILHEADSDGNNTFSFIEFLKVIRVLQDKDWHGFNECAAERAGSISG